MLRPRKIIKIDEEKCDGCGLCVPACQEGAIQVIDGKARLVNEAYCDGLGSCLGECPQGAITIEERMAPEFDPHAVARNTQDRRQEPLRHPASPPPAKPVVQGCPGAMAQSFDRSEPRSRPRTDEESVSYLRNWPIQIALVPIHAPYLQGADLLIAADCVPFTLADFHRRFLRGRVLLIGCPKLDDSDFYRRKLSELFLRNKVRSVEVAYMEVPCCFGLVNLVRLALEDSSLEIELTLTKVGIRGSVCETVGSREPHGEPEKAPIEVK